MKKLIMKQIAGLVLVALVGATSACKTSTRYARSTGEYWDDKTIAHNVRKGLKQNSLTKGADINVTSFRGNVSLTGFVDAPVQKDMASNVARDTQGVRWFQNNIAVKDYMPYSQARIPDVVNEPAGADTGRWQKGVGVNELQSKAPQGSTTYRTQPSTQVQPRSNGSNVGGPSSSTGSGGPGTQQYNTEPSNQR